MLQVKIISLFLGVLWIQENSVIGYWSYYDEETQLYWKDVKSPERDVLDVMKNYGGYLEFRNDMSFSSKLLFRDQTGTYAINSETITLDYGLGEKQQIPCKYKIKNGKLYFSFLDSNWIVFRNESI